MSFFRSASIAYYDTFNDSLQIFIIQLSNALQPIIIFFKKGIPTVQHEQKQVNQNKEKVHLRSWGWLPTPAMATVLNDIFNSDNSTTRFKSKWNAFDEGLCVDSMWLASKGLTWSSKCYLLNIKPIYLRKLWEWITQSKNTYLCLNSYWSTTQHEVRAESKCIMSSRVCEWLRRYIWMDVSKRAISFWTLTDLQSWSSCGWTIERRIWVHVSDMSVAELQ